MDMDFRLPALQKLQGEPIYLQLYRRFRDAIAEGKLRPGDRVPSVRSLASELNLARGTVETAYQMLGSEGYLLARGPAGTVVSPRLADRIGRGAPPVRPCSPPAPRTTATEPPPFQLGLPALDMFPRKTWARLAGRHARSLDVAAMAYPDPCGHEALRHAIASYLGISRGIACTPEQVFVTAGYRCALDLVCRAVLQPGDTGWFEDPGYRFARQFLEQAGMRLSPVAVDDDGLDVEAGLRQAGAARFALVTPSHQSPLGVSLSLPRRLALLAWASAGHGWIVEDDYDSEFRYHGRPLPALKSLDRAGRVLYTGTFSKVLFPGLRLAYLVVPESQIARFRETASVLHGHGAILHQATVADFMAQGHFARHLKTMRSLYAERRGYLLDALTQVFGDALYVPPRRGGIHLLAHPRTGCSDRTLATLANAEGLAVEALSAWGRLDTSPEGLLLGFTNLATAGQALGLCRRLEKAWGHLPGPSVA
ncbi:PLP-dependent aminotransferase family protein [Microvirgula aerodenitrificans]|uniref:MocR-like pyridoxine biosynthesis transcription factor PdxR n=1 Tax=Microvirgula aerodenitrificans TaxID=57480 RepID=UPI0028E2539E|nr:PLP-dependent aminotransferase family protein [Microvirgula aerodenitrificans]